MATLTDAVRTVRTMAEIPGLRGGFACFDEDLDCVGWDTQQDNRGSIWTLVPDDAALAAGSVEAGIREAGEGLLGMVSWAQNEADEDEHDLACLRERYAGGLGRLSAAVTADR